LLPGDPIAHPPAAAGAIFNNGSFDHPEETVSIRAIHEEHALAVAELVSVELTGRRFLNGLLHLIF
jgi:hypothetical protein